MRLGLRPSNFRASNHFGGVPQVDPSARFLDNLRKKSPFHLTSRAERSESHGSSKIEFRALVSARTPTIAESVVTTQYAFVFNVFSFAASAVACRDGSLRADSSRRARPLRRRFYRSTDPPPQIKKIPPTPPPNPPPAIPRESSTTARGNRASTLR